MKQKIESKLNVTKSEQVELHVLVANPAAWRPDSWQAYERGASISIGFVKAEFLTTLFDLRSLLIQQLRPESLPDQQEEDQDRQRLLEIEEQKRKIFEERKKREQEIEDEIREEEEKAMAVYGSFRSSNIFGWIYFPFSLLSVVPNNLKTIPVDLKRKQAEKKRLAEEARLAELERVAKQEEEDRRKRAQELERKRKEVHN
eukprot:sb/3470682/